MIYDKSKRYDGPEFRSRIMGLNPVKVAEELLIGHRIAPQSTVMDLGCGKGVTSVFLAREYGFKVYATDLWCDPSENQKFFASCGLSEAQIVAVNADTEVQLPFEKGFFDAIVSVDAYHYFGRNPKYLDEKLLPYLKPGGLMYLAFPGMKRDLHDNLPPELLLSWTPEQLETMHDTAYWRRIFEASSGAEIVSVSQMESNEEMWADWLACENEDAIGDRKSMNAGGGKYLNFIAAVLRKR